MSTPHIVTPQEAQLAQAEAMRGAQWQPFTESLLHTVATEPDRLRAAVVKALRTLGDKFIAAGHNYTGSVVHGEADDIENGADYE